MFSQIFLALVEGQLGTTHREHCSLGSVMLFPWILIISFGGGATWCRVVFSPKVSIHGEHCSWEGPSIVVSLVCYIVFGSHIGRMNDGRCLPECKRPMA